MLVGAADEMTDASFAILNRLGSYKQQPVSSLALFNSNLRGSIGGEGVAFFLLTGEQSPNNLAEFKGVLTFHKPKDIAVIVEKIASFLYANDLKINDIDLVITGKNGNPKSDVVYNELNRSFFKDKAIANFKHLSGEYPTVTSFALWMAANILKRQEVPEVVKESGVFNRPIQNVLIYNHYSGSHSLMLLSTC